MYIKKTKQGNSVTKIAKKLGDLSVSQTCVWCVHQPKVPASMKKETK